MMFAAKIKGLQQNNEVKKFFKPIRLKDVKIVKNGTGVVFFRNEKDLLLGLKKNGKLQNKVVKVIKQETNIEKEKKTKNKQESWPVKSQDELEALILETGRLYVRNLSYLCSEKDLEKLFLAYGSLSDVHLSYDKWTNKSKGYAFITYMFPVDAVKAFKKLDKTKFMDRLLHILPGQESNDVSDVSKSRSNYGTNDENLGQFEKSTFQTNRFEELKNSAGVGHNWNTLFIRPDAVATYLAAKFGLSTEQVLNPSQGGSVSVRLAHGETQLINELRTFLQDNGVKLEAFETDNDAQSHRRHRLEAKSTSTLRPLSATAFLVKNLPVGTNRAELCGLLRRYSKTSDGLSTTGLKRVVVPPLGITAIVEYKSSQQAKLMFKKLAYEPFKDSVLFLQWLPENALEPVEESSGKADFDLDETSLKSDNAEFEIITSIPDNEDTQQMQTEDADCSIADETVIQPESKRVRKYKNKNEKLKELDKSRGQDETVNDDNSIDPSVENVVPSAKTNQFPDHKQTTPNRVVIVRNVPFQATLKELKQLFEPVGGLINIRMPKKATGGHRGFAFLEFTTLDQAKTALETLGLATHFLGRRLRLEYADQS